MLKPFYIKKKNIDNRLVPEVSAADAGKVLGVTDEGKIAAVEGGGGGGGFSKLIEVFDEASIRFIIPSITCSDLFAKILSGEVFLLMSEPAADYIRVWYFENAIFESNRYQFTFGSTFGTAIFTGAANDNPSYSAD